MRKIIQILQPHHSEMNMPYLVALCDDGTFWYMENGKWNCVEPIPQDPTDLLLSSTGIDEEENKLNEKNEELKKRNEELQEKIAVMIKRDMNRDPGAGFGL